MRELTPLHVRGVLLPDGEERDLWLVGDRAFKVQTVLTEPELRLTDTNEALTAGRPA